MTTTLINKCDDCGAVIAVRTISEPTVHRICGNADANPEGYTFPTVPSADGNTTIIKWGICTPCYRYEMEQDIPY
jgi:hypothetical protein